MTTSKINVITVMTPDLSAIAILADELKQKKGTITTFIKRKHIKVYSYAGLVVVNKMEFYDAWFGKQVHTKKKYVINAELKDLHFILSIEQEGGSFSEKVMHLEYKTKESIKKWVKENYPEHRLIFNN